MDLVEAAASGDRLAALRALRDRLAEEIDGCQSSRDMAALSRQLTDVLGQIDALERASAPAEKGTGLDELNARRAARESGAARSA